jgi:hypothetical protein
MDDDIRDRALQGLAEALRSPLTVEGLREWAHEDEQIRVRLLEGRIFGTIRWRTSIGRPLAPTLASGFRIEHRYHELDWELGPGGQPVDISRWRDGSPPNLWDRPGDDDHYEVGFACWGVKPWKNSVRIQLSDSQPWDTQLQLELSDTFRVVVPEVQVILLAGASYAVLDPVTVEARPIRQFA